MTKERRLAVLASGRGSDLQSLLDARRDGKITSRVALVLSDNAEARALERAEKEGIKRLVIEPDARLRGSDRRDEHGERVAQALEKERTDLIVLAGYMRVLGTDFVRRFPNRIINIHPSLLPSFGGLHAQKQALEWGARVAGCTTHFVDEEVDHGPIILQAAVPVAHDDTEETLSKRILSVEHQILPRTVNLWENGRLHVEGRWVRIDADESWARRYPTLPDVLYGPGY